MCNHSANFIIPVMATILPMSPWNTFAPLYLLLVRSCPSTWFLGHILLRVAVFLVNFAFWLQVLDFVAMNVVVNFMIGISSLKCCIKLFGQVATISISETRLSMYREIQILVDLYNCTHRYTCTFGVILLGVLSIITFSFLVVGNFRELTSIMLLFGSLGVMAGNFHILLSYGNAADVNKYSRSIYERIEHNLRGRTGKHGKWIKRAWRSCPTFKVQFLGNYFEDTTPLVFLQFCVDQTTSLILLNS